MEPQKTVLVVDDDSDSRNICSLFLQHHGYRVVEAVDGEEGVRRARVEHPALILMDVTLPVLDGWAATEQLKDDPETASIPVVILTGHALERDRARALSIGEGYLPKPCTPRRILEEVQRLIGLAAN
ncbi:MAG TPA: response regulator [Longimicrobiaceae bacterium]|nr:response regulator [Longimicrobiaceae bacterium]